MKLQVIEGGKMKASNVTEKPEEGPDGGGKKKSAGWRLDSSLIDRFNRWMSVKRITPSDALELVVADLARTKQP